MGEEVDARVVKLRTTLCESARTIVHEQFPAKIEAMTQLVKRIGVEAEAVRDRQDEYLDVEGPVPGNSNVMNVLKTLKEEIMALVDMMDTLNTWIRLHSPRFEEGNNFGVGVQEEIASMLIVGRSSSVALLETASKFHMARGHAAAKARKYAHVADHRTFVRDLDSKQLFSLRQTLTDLRNTYVLLYDRILKNFEKLEKPKGESGGGSAMSMMF